MKISLVMMLALACSGDPDGKDTLEDTSSPIAATDADADADADTDADADADDTGVTPDIDDAVLRILTSGSVVLPSSEGGSLEVSCLQETSSGIERLDSATVSISPSEGTSAVEGTWTFMSDGTYTITCSTSERTAEVTVQVIGEVMSRGAVEVAAVIGEMEAALIDVLLASGGEDGAFVEAYERLVDASEVDLERPTMPWRDLPAAFWPSSDALEAEGLTAHEDDAELADALADLSAAISAVRATLASQDPSLTTETGVAEMASADEALEAAAEAFAALEPTIHGWYAHGDTLQAEVLDPLIALAAETTAFHTAQLSTEGAEVLPPFGLVSVVTGSLLQGSLRHSLIGMIYKDAFKAIDASINNLIAMELISTALPPTGDLTVDYIYASSSYGYALPGYSTTIHGSGFSTNPGLNQFFIVGVGWQGVVSSILDGCGLASGSLMDRLESARTCLGLVRDGAEGTYPEGTSVEEGILAPQVVNIGAFPDVCGSGWIPVTIGMMSMNLETGARTDFTPLVCLP